MSKLDHCPSLGDLLCADSLTEPRFILETGPLGRQFPADPADPQMNTPGPASCIYFEPGSGRGALDIIWPDRPNGLRLRCTGRFQV